MIALRAGDHALDLDPARGGAVVRFDWRDQPVFRRAEGPSVLDASCFPLVPFSNRIELGQFEWRGRDVALSPNFPGNNHPHPLHGFGWLNAWHVREQSSACAVLDLRHPAGDWPWPFAAEQRFLLDGQGLRITLSLTNLGDEPMPAGLGLHPYFPRTARTGYRAWHRGQWHNDADCLPRYLEMREMPHEWWQGEPVDSLQVDTVFTDREGPILIDWPERSMRLTISPSPLFTFTCVYVPADAEWFCAEPASHMTNAVNSERDDSGMIALAPGKVLEGWVDFSLETIAAQSLPNT